MIASNITRIRERHTVTIPMRQIDLARALGVAPCVVCNWENDKINPNAESLVKLSHVLGVTVDELLKE